jgi:hypothetical protein
MGRMATLSFGNSRLNHKELLSNASDETLQNGESDDFPNGDYLGQAYVYNRVPGYCEETAGAATLLAEALEGMEVDFPRMAESAASEWSTATALADEIVLRTKLSFRDAHDVVARMVRYSLGITLCSAGERGDRADARPRL